MTARTHARGGHRRAVVYVTGSNEAQVAIEAIKAGAADYVIKTVSDDFLSLLRAQSSRPWPCPAESRQGKGGRRNPSGKERAEALLAEVNHRVANSLALVASLLRLQISSARSEEVKAELAETQARITAMPACIAASTPPTTSRRWNSTVISDA